MGLVCGKLAAHVCVSVLLRSCPATAVVCQELLEDVPMHSGNSFSEHRAGQQDVTTIGLLQFVFSKIAQGCLTRYNVQLTCVSTVYAHFTLSKINDRTCGLHSMCSEQSWCQVVVKVDTIVVADFSARETNWNAYSPSSMNCVIANT